VTPPTPITRRLYVGPVDDDAPLDDLEQLFVETMVSALLKVIRQREAEGVNLLAPDAGRPASMNRRSSLPPGGSDDNPLLRRGIQTRSGE
jgi:hypothetical protein